MRPGSYLSSDSFPINLSWFDSFMARFANEPRRSFCSMVSCVAFRVLIIMFMPSIRTISSWWLSSAPMLAIALAAALRTSISSVLDSKLSKVEHPSCTY